MAALMTEITDKPAPASRSRAARAAGLVVVSLLILSSPGAALQFGGPIKIFPRSGESVTGEGRALDGEGGNAVIVLRDQVHGARITGVTIVNAERAIETNRGADVSDLVVDGLDGRVQRECFRVRGDRITIRNTHCSLVGGPRRGMRNLPGGLHIESGSDILIENSSFEGFQMVGDDRQYLNGDGISAERPVRGLTIRNVTANNNSDAGFDIKPPVTMDAVSATGNCRNYRLWNNADIGTMTVGDVVKRGGSNSCIGIWVKGRAPVATTAITIRRLIVATTRPTAIIKIEDGAADIRIDACDTAGSTGDIFISREGPASRITLGRGCEALAIRDRGNEPRSEQQQLGPDQREDRRQRHLDHPVVDPVDQ